MSYYPSTDAQLQDKEVSFESFSTYKSKCTTPALFYWSSEYFVWIESTVVILALTYRIVIGSTLHLFMATDA